MQILARDYPQQQIANGDGPSVNNDIFEHFSANFATFLLSGGMSERVTIRLEKLGKILNMVESWETIILVLRPRSQFSRIVGECAEFYCVTISILV